MKTAPNGCLEVPINIANFKITKIYLDDNREEHILYENQKFQIPNGFLLNQMISNNSLYVLCGLDFISNSLKLNLKFRSCKNNSIEAEFCFIIFKGRLIKFELDVTIFENSRYRPMILPHKYYHEYIYFNPNQMEAFIDRQKYSTMYDNIWAIKAQYNDEIRGNSITLVKNCPVRTYMIDMGDINIVLSPSEVIYLKVNKNKPLLCHISLYWTDNSNKVEHVTAFQISDIFQPVKSFNNRQINFNFQAFSNNYMMAIYFRGYVEYFCSTSIETTEIWCQENIDNKNDIEERKLKNNEYQFPNFDHKFAVIVLTHKKLSPNKITPIHRYYLDFTNQKIYSFHVTIFRCVY
ncbi:hypothetical protein HZS_6983 [Henneguya salminicola]|nr:hypothetical protein HZS_6983 [Henneguya salminicola]